METVNNGFQDFVRWFRDNISRPITRNSGELEEIFQNLGLNTNGQSINIPQDVQDRINAFSDSETENSDIDALVSIITDVKQVVDSVWSFAEAMSNSEAKPEEIASFVSQYFLLESLRRDVPVIYKIFRIMNGIGAVGEEAGSGSGLVNFFKVIINYFKEFGEAHEEYGKNHSPDNIDYAQRLSDGYFIGVLAVVIVLGKVFPSVFEEIAKKYSKAAHFGLDLPPSTVHPLANSISNRTLTFAISDKTTLVNGDTIGGSAYLSLMFVPKKHGGPAFMMGLAGSGEIKPKLSDTWSALMKFDSGKSYIRIGEGGGTSGDATNGTVTVGFNREASSTAQKTVFGSTTGTRFEIGGVEIKVKANASDADFKFGFKDTAIVIVPNNGFMRSFMAGQSKIGFELGIGYSIKKGLYLDGGSGISITLPMHLRLGPITVQLVYLQFKSTENPSGFKLELSTAFSVVLGPLVISVDRMGLKMAMEKNPNPPAGTNPWDFKIGAQPPRGLGIRVDASVVKGGGFVFFDPENGQYAGALELSIQNTIQVGAIGIITTKGIPDASGNTSDGFSLLIILSVSFTPGFALGMGFFLTGLGGMLGLHRTVNADKLLESVRNNAIDSILFPEDIIANAPTIIRQIQAIFPPKKDQFIIGLMAKISWGAANLCSIQFGLAVEFSNPVKIAILGVLKINVGSNQRGILRLQLNFIGLIDFEKKSLSFDASLYDSRIIEVLTIEGDMCVRVNWGNDAGFVVSVGGFHPSFTPPAALNVPKMKRFTINILGENPKISITAYIAVTSNTFQFGAKIELKFKAGKFSLEGYLGFDVLFQFNPFKFIANIQAGIAIKMGGTTLFSLEIEFELSGPAPWNAKGSVKFKILFITIKINFNVTWGESIPTESNTGVLVIPLMQQALTNDQNWIAELPPNRYDLITLREIPPQKDLILVQAFGALRISQNILPLDFTINKFGNLKPSDIKQVDFTEVRIGGESMELEGVTDKFAPANFNQMDDKQKLKSPSFENKKSGVKIKATDSIVTNYGINRPVEYEVKVSDFDPNPMPMALFAFEMPMFQAMAMGGAIGKSELSVANSTKSFKNKSAVSISEEKFVIVNSANMTPFDAGMLGLGESQAQQTLDNILVSKPHLQDELLIVPAYHLV